MTTYEIKFKNLPLEVTGEYFQERWSGGSLTPPEPAEFTIHKIELCGHDIFDLIDMGTELNELENLILEKFY